MIIFILHNIYYIIFDRGGLQLLCTKGRGDFMTKLVKLN